MTKPNFKIPKNEAEKFYLRILSILNKEKIPFLIGGTYATQKYTGIIRKTNDMDVFCLNSDVLKILDILAKEGIKVEMSDERWIAKAFDRHFVIDFIFGTQQGIIPVDQSWFDNPVWVEMFNLKVRLVPLEEMIYSKAYRQDLFRFEGPDINHLILKQGKKIDWQRLLNKMDPHWEILFAHIINFRFVYPSERSIIPEWIIEEFVRRLKLQQTTPPPQAKISRGPLLAVDPYQIDIFEWGYKDIF